MNRGGVICYKEAKLSFHNDLAFPKFSIINPELTFTLPDKQVANGIVDTFIHVCEQYITYPVSGAFQDRTAEGILKTLIEVGRKTLDDKEDYDLRANLVWCATMALNGLIGSGVPQDWSCHMIGHELTAKFNIDHARTLAVVLPNLWRVRKKEKFDKLLQYATRVWNITDGTDDEKIEMAIQKTEEFFESLDVKLHLRDYNIDKNRLIEIKHSLEEYNKTALSERKTLTPDIALEILEKSY
ncbi:MAG: iron-containing alcohol dehydrogenase [Clostridium sp.]